MLWKESLLVIFGWLLGLLANIITTYAKDKKKSKTIKSGIHNELIELQHRLVLSAFAYNLDHGKFDHDFLRWVREHCSSYKGINKNEQIEKTVDSFLVMPEKALQDFVIGQRDETKGKSVKYARIPFLESQLSNIGLFSSDKQTILLEILEHVKIYNETADEAKVYFSRTFDPDISDTNRQIVETSLNEKYMQLAHRSRIIAERIDAFFK